MPPDTPGQPSPAYTPATPTAPGVPQAAFSASAPTAPGVAVAAFSASTPTAPGVAVAAFSASTPTSPSVVIPGITAAVKASLTITKQVTLGVTRTAVFIEAVTKGSAGNDITVQFVGTADGSPTGPYLPAVVTSVVVTGSAIVFNWFPTQSTLTGVVVGSAINNSPAARALIGALVIEEGSINWPTSPTALTGGTDA